MWPADPYLEVLFVGVLRILGCVGVLGSLGILKVFRGIRAILGLPRNTDPLPYLKRQKLPSFHFMFFDRYENNIPYF